MNQDSFIKMSPDVVLKMCEKAIKCVKEERETRRNKYETKRNKYLDNMIEGKNNGFFHKLFKRRDWTRNNLECWLNKQDVWAFYHWHFTLCDIKENLPHIWKNNMETALRLGRATEGTTETMLISTSDYDRLSAF